MCDYQALLNWDNHILHLVLKVFIGLGLLILFYLKKEYSKVYSSLGLNEHLVP